MVRKNLLSDLKYLRMKKNKIQLIMSLIWSGEGRLNNKILRGKYLKETNFCDQFLRHDVTEFLNISWLKIKMDENQLIIQSIPYKCDPSFHEWLQHFFPSQVPFFLYLYPCQYKHWPHHRQHGKGTAMVGCVLN